MYLTRLTLDPRSAQARRDLGDAYDMHRTLARAFVADAGSSPARFLWRLEAGGNAWSTPVVLVQAATEGDWSALHALPNYLQRPVESKCLDLAQWVEGGARYRFRLQANPTVTRQGKRYGLLGEDEQLAWLGRQGERNGFSVEAALVTGSDRLASRKGDSRISLQRACFEGRLQVQELTAFSRALTAGIGPAKAFGCGLLSVARS
ncbi:type I-E CRISPR-associated protein Cas6/Cse3/CasE [Phytopseudomonas dryadis]|uniref:Type I-E CRISPR-associated protein Cas6/Cse3/CasE n=1 Tax=Phytopseudomonas dryadis TaxID=2487520 RepID=A0ABY1ZAL4_9GAMM|nr:MULTISPECIES: type I-E CRISPR-associated protein Cas6/Cse3/CasE [Pseudomonas]TBV08938.1 type I-E CRISPR-associated protein Cas6/Cse3/CasE [Pseudomonas dryadis]TBV15123.1 type I-E CRISPR-associated protein Cas6/Cse3/CasE [Pseudomonas sp. FRB 230]